ncbi:MAG: PEP-CTERM sorting domain-containing protein [Fimbriimonadales bacterium]|nr:PEP-CTERM sorting domain-containing protein [Fimbriimonadales bacterium]
MRYWNRCLGFVVSAAAALSAVQAQNLIQNGSFEEYQLGNGQPGFILQVFITNANAPTYIPGWQVVQDNVDLFYDVPGRTGQHLNQYVDLNGSPGLGRIQQQVTVLSGQGGLYNFRFRVAASWSFSSQPDPDNPGLTYGQADALLPRIVRAQILPAGGGSPLFSEDINLNTEFGVTYGNGDFYQVNRQLNLPVGNWIVAFESLTNSRPWPEVGADQPDSLGVQLDDVQLELVPEPSSMLALAAGGVGMLLWRRRK